MDAAAITSIARAVHHELGRAPTRPGFAVRSPVRPGAAGWSFRVRDPEPPAPTAPPSHLPWGPAPLVPAPCQPSSRPRS